MSVLWQKEPVSGKIQSKNFNNSVWNLLLWVRTIKKRFFQFIFVLCIINILFGIFFKEFEEWFCLNLKNHIWFFSKIWFNTNRCCVMFFQFFYFVQKFVVKNLFIPFELWEVEILLRIINRIWKIFCKVKLLCFVPFFS